MVDLRVPGRVSPLGDGVFDPSYRTTTVSVYVGTHTVVTRTPDRTTGGVVVVPEWCRRGR